MLSTRASSRGTWSREDLAVFLRPHLCWTVIPKVVFATPEGREGSKKVRTEVIQT